MLWQLDPNKSAQENLWNCIHVNVFAFKNRAIRRGLRLTYDEWADIIQDASISAYTRFMSRLRRGKYDRNQTFFMNVWSCMYMVFHNIVKKYLRDYVQTKANSYDRLDVDKAQHMVNTERMPMYTGTYKRPEESETEEKFWEYLNSCIETGCRPDRRNPDYLFGLYEATGQRPHLTLTLERRRRVGIHVFGEVSIFGQKICDTEELEKVIPPGKYRLYTKFSKSQRRTTVYIDTGNTFKFNPYFFEKLDLHYGMGRISLKTGDDRKQLLSVVERGHCTLEIKDCPDGAGVEPAARPEAEPPRPDCANQSK